MSIVHLNLKKLTFKILACTLLFGLTSSFNTSNQISKEQAIQLAEEFISDNGYTKLPANKSKLRYELFDGEYTIDEMLKNRHNRLHPKALFISEDYDKWYVGFLSSNIDPTKLNASQLKSNLKERAVIIIKGTNEIRIAHKEPNFSGTFIIK